MGRKRRYKAWVKQQAKRDAEEAATAETRWQRTGELAGLEPPPTEPTVFHFGQPHKHYCADCKVFWTHESEFCHNPGVMVRCPKHASSNHP